MANFYLVLQDRGGVQDGNVKVFVDGRRFDTKAEAQAFVSDLVIRGRNAERINIYKARELTFDMLTETVSKEEIRGVEIQEDNGG